MGVILFQENMQEFYFSFAIIGQFYEYAIRPEVSMTPVSWCFAIICLLILLVKNAHPFLIVSLQANICNTSYDQKSQQHMEMVFFLRLN